jgi:hypothetical protein
MSRLRVRLDRLDLTTQISRARPSAHSKFKIAMELPGASLASFVSPTDAPQTTRISASLGNRGAVHSGSKIEANASGPDPRRHSTWRTTHLDRRALIPHSGQPRLIPPALATSEKKSGCQNLLQAWRKPAALKIVCSSFNPPDSTSKSKKITIDIASPHRVKELPDA